MNSSVWFVTKGGTAPKDTLHGGQLVCADCRSDYCDGAPSGVYLLPAGVEVMAGPRKCAACCRREPGPKAADA